MKTIFTLNVKELSSALSVLVPVSTHSDSNRPILRNIRVDFVGGKVTLSATNLDVYASIVLWAGTFSSNEASFLLASLDIKNMVKGKKGEVTFEYDADKKNIYITTANLQTTCSANGVEGFPDFLTSSIPDYCIRMEAADVKTALESVSYAVADNKAMYSLSGVFMSSHNGCMEFAATDTHRMAFHKVKALNEDLPEVKHILAQDSLRPLSRLLGQSTGNVTIFSSDSNQGVTFEGYNWKLYTHCIEGTFPRYHEVVPTNPQYGFKANTQELYKACDSLLTKVQPVHKSVYLLPTESGLDIKAEFTDSDADVRCSVSADSKGAIPTKFNAYYLASMFAVVRGESVVCKYSPERPMVLIDGDTTHVLSPIYKKGVDSFEGGFTEEQLVGKRLYAASLTPDAPEAVKEVKADEKPFKVSAKDIKALIKTVQEKANTYSDSDAWLYITTAVNKALKAE